MQRTAAKWALLALALVVTAGATPAIASGSLFTETFRNATVPGWTLTGKATLPSGTVDPNNNGWLRLTGNTTNQAGFAGSTRGQTKYHQIWGMALLSGQNVPGYATVLVMSVMNGFLLITYVSLRQKGKKQ